MTEAGAPSRWQIVEADCVAAMRAMQEGSIDAVVSDPPYGLEFMGKKWDAPWQSDPRVDTPWDTGTGLSVANMVAFQDWSQAWAGEALRVLKPGGHLAAFGGTRTYHRLAAGVESAGFEIRDCLAWLYGSGFPKSRTVLKPAFEPIVLARKPLIGSVARNVLAHGTGALNVDGCRIDTGASGRGRWPPNVILDERAAALLDAQAGELTSGREAPDGHRGNGAKFRTVYGTFARGERRVGVLYGDSGGASRFYYCAKASTAERSAGLGRPGESPGDDATQDGRNPHPTVKPIALMRWVIRLVTPPGGVVLDPFTGSGTTGCAAVLEGFRFVGVEREADYAAIAEARVAWWAAQPEGIDVAAALVADRRRSRTTADGQIELFGGGA